MKQEELRQAIKDALGTAALKTVADCYSPDKARLDQIMELINQHVSDVIGEDEAEPTEKRTQSRAESESRIMKTTIASEKEKKKEELNFVMRNDKSMTIGMHNVYMQFFSDSLDQIASVARQEGRDEAVEEILNKVDKEVEIIGKDLAYMGAFGINGARQKIYNFTRKLRDEYLAKLTGKEENENR